MTSYIFDFDGVLGNTFKPLSLFLSQYFLKSPEKIGILLRESMMQNQKLNGLKEWAKGVMTKNLLKYFQEYPESLLFANRMDEIAQIQSPKAILSNNYSTICKSILGNQTEQFSHILGQDIVENKLQGLEIIFQDPKFTVDNCIFITDTIGDVLEVSKKLPIQNIYGVSWGYHSAQELEDVLPPQHILTDFTNMPVLD